MQHYAFIFILWCPSLSILRSVASARSAKIRKPKYPQRLLHSRSQIPQNHRSSQTLSLSGPQIFSFSLWKKFHSFGPLSAFRFRTPEKLHGFDSIQGHRVSKGSSRSQNPGLHWLRSWDFNWLPVDLREQAQRRGFWQRYHFLPRPTGKVFLLQYYFLFSVFNTRNWIPLNLGGFFEFWEYLFFFFGCIKKKDNILRLVADNIFKLQGPNWQQI